MGWSIDLKADKTIDPDDIDQIVQQLPQTLIGFTSRQSWGWSTAVDIYNPEGTNLVLGGSFTQSGRIAQHAAQTIADLLRQRGYKIEVGEME